MRAHRLLCVVALSVVVLPLVGCDFRTLSNLRARLGGDYAMGHLVLEEDSSGITPTVQAAELVGIKSLPSDNVDLWFDGRGVGDARGMSRQTITYSVPGVPVAFDEHHGADGRVVEIVVVTSDGVVHLIDTVTGNVRQIGQTSTLFSISTVRFYGEEGRRHVLVGGFGAVASAVTLVEDGNGDYSLGTIPAIGPVSTATRMGRPDGTRPDYAAIALEQGGSNIRIFTEDIDGNLSQSDAESVPGTPVHMNTHDFIEDGEDDLAVLAAGFPGGEARFFKNNGDGTVTLTDSVTIPAGFGVYKTAFADFNSDGFDDCAIADGITDLVTIYLGDGAGHFTISPFRPTTVPDVLLDMAASDFDDDCSADLFSLSRNERVATVQYGDGTGALVGEHRYEHPLVVDVQDIDVANIDQSGDDEPEVFVLGSPSNTGSFPYDMYRATWDPVTGTFSGWTLVEENLEARTLHIADADGVNGKDIWYVGSANGVQLLLNDGSGAFAPAPPGFGTGQLLDFELADLDGDGDIDAITNTAGRLTVWTNVGNLTFLQGPESEPIAGDQAIGFDDEGEPWVVVTLPGVIERYAIQPDASLVLTDSVDISGLNGVRDFRIVDVNGDGFDDAIVLLAATSSTAQQVVTLINDQAGGFDMTPVFTHTDTGDAWLVDADAADLDNDGRMDIVASFESLTSDYIVAFIQNPDGTFSPAEMHIQGEVSGPLLAADLSGDGRKWILSGKQGVRAGLSVLATRPGFGPNCCGPADLDGSGGINTNDFFLFLQLYQNMDPRADFTGEGQINTNDFFAFLVAYQQGC